MTAKPPRPDITGKYAAYLRDHGLSCHSPLAWLGSDGGCEHPDHAPLTLDVTRGDVNLIEMALRSFLIREEGSEPFRESMKNTLRKVESLAVVKASR